MKTIKGFEGEELEVSDFGEWVGNDFIDYKFEYENNQKIIKILQQENQQLKNQLKEKHDGFMASVDESCDLAEEIQKYKEVIDKINVFLDNHDKNAGKLYYKYDNKYLLSEIKEDIRDILKEVE